MTLYARFAAHLDAALDALVASGDLPAGLERRAVTVEPPRDASHGDLATNAAMVLAKPARMKPRDIADALVAELASLPGYVKVEVAGPGFVNISLAPDRWQSVIADVREGGERYGASDLGKGEKLLVEYVSANPTGPMHVGHGRGAVDDARVPALRLRR